MTFLAQSLISGVALGVVIGGLPLALGVGLQGSGGLNFAQGQLATLSAYLSWQLVALGAHFGTAMIVSVAISLAVGVVAVLFRFTGIGLQMRAAASNAASSELSGINLRLTLALGWGIAAAVGAVAGTVSAPVTGLSPDINSGTLLLAFAAAALGG